MKPHSMLRSDHLAAAVYLWTSMGQMIVLENQSGSDFQEIA